MSVANLLRSNAAVFITLGGRTVDNVLKPDIGREWQFLPLYIWIRRLPRQNIAVTFGVGKLEWCGYPTVEKFENIFIRFDREHESD